MLAKTTFLLLTILLAGAHCRSAHEQGPLATSGTRATSPNPAKAIKKEVRSIEICGNKWARDSRSVTCFNNGDSHDLSQLNQFPELEEFEIELSDASALKALVEYPKIRSLIVSGLHAGDMSPLAAVTHLRSLSLEDISILDLSALSTLTELVRLDLAKSGHVANFQFVSAMQELREVHLGQAAFDLETLELRDFAPILSLTKLEKLSVGGHRLLSERAWDLLPKLTSLVELAVTAPARLEVLQALDLKGLRIHCYGGHLGLENLSKLKTLLRLSLAFCDELGSIDPLHALNQLESLDLSFTGVTDISGLADFAHLRYLNLRGAKVPSIQITALRAALPNIVVVIPSTNKEQEAQAEERSDFGWPVFDDSMQPLVAD